MNYAEIKFNDIANGEGVRTSLFVTGCRHHCKNCFNKVTWDFNSGKKFDDKTKETIFKATEPYWIDGLTILGGEPFEPENQKELLNFLIEFHYKYPNKSVWCYSGFIFEELTGKFKSRAYTETSKELLKNIDVLVDGQYIDDLKDITLKFRGSSNQRIIDVKRSLEFNQIILYMK